MHFSSSSLETKVGVQVAPLVAQASDAGTPWQAIDIAETALRNLSTLLAPEGRAQALLHCQPGHATLVVTYLGELLSTRQMDLARRTALAYPTLADSTPLIEAPPPVRFYAPGSWGPNAIHQIIAPHTWRLPFERAWREQR